MRNILIIFLLLAISSPVFSQTVITVNGQSFTSTYDVPHSSTTTLTFTNNIFSTSVSTGYQLDAGDEVVQSSNNNLDGAVITGNRFIWNGSDGSATMHALFTGYNKNVVVKYNYLYRPPLGIVRKSSGMNNTSGGVAYNIIVDPIVGVIAKGMNDVNIYNNTFYSTKSSSDTWHGLIDIYINNDEGQNAYSTNTKIFNNIFYTEKQRLNIYIYETACLTGFECDYNVYYCASGTPEFMIAGTSYTFTQWKALGYDTHSILINPNFIDLTNFVPTTRLDYGKDLGTDWISGLAPEAVWGTTSPATNDQNGTWQAGARVFAASTVPVTSITVTGAAGANTVPVSGTLQLTANILPSNATNKSVTWTISNGTGQAYISSSGLVTGIATGTVTAKATAQDGSGKSGTLTLTVVTQSVPVTSITVTGSGGASAISTDNGTLQLIATVLPANASNPAVTWSIVNGTGEATISSDGLVSAVANGIVTAIASVTDGSGVTGSLFITISNQTIPVTGITVSGAGGATTISTDNGTLQLTATVSPSNATNKTIVWSVNNGSGQATINSAGLLSAVSNGTVSARATATDGSGVSGSIVITISNQIVPVTSISVSGAGGASIITTDNGTLQLTATVLPSSASNKVVTWSIVNGTGQATISSSGLVTALTNGTVTATATATDGTGVTGSLLITISSQLIPVTSITISGSGGATTVTTDNGSLQMNADVQPVTATIRNVFWSVAPGTGNGTISQDGIFTAVSDGTVSVIASATDGSGVTGSLTLTLSNQIVQVTSVSVTSEGGATAIFDENGTLQLYADVLPSYATDQSVTWTIESGTGEASIDATGLVTAISNGTVTAKATANDDSGIFGTLQLTISGQVIIVTHINVTSESGGSTINARNGSLQLLAEVLPENATDKNIVWSVNNITGDASISTAGLITANANGVVTATASATDGSGITGSMDINISINNDKPYTVIVNSDEIRLTFYEDFTTWMINMYDFMGNLTGRKKIDSDIITFSRRSVAPGLYLIVITKGDQLYVEKVVIV